MRTFIRILVQTLILFIIGSDLAWALRFRNVNNNGIWHDEANWETSVNSTQWQPAGRIPTAADNDIEWIEIRKGTVIEVTDDLEVNRLFVYGTLKASASMVVINGPERYDMTIGSLLNFTRGYLEHCANIEIQTGAEVDALFGNWKLFHCVSEGLAASSSSSGSLDNLGKMIVGVLWDSSGVINNLGELTVTQSFTFSGGSVTGNPLLYQDANVALLIDDPADSVSTVNFWPHTGGPSVLYVRGGGVALKTPRTVSRFYLSDTMDCTNLTVTGTLEIQPGGWVTGPPTYGPSSQLWYHTGGIYARNAEWSADSGAGYPANVYIQDTTLDYPNGSKNGHAISGNLEIAGALRMDYGNVGVENPLIIGGDINLRGIVALGDAPGGDLHLRGREWIHGNANFIPNSRAVVFEGTVEQFISGSPTFDDLVVNNLAGVTVFGGSSMTVNQKLIFTAGNLAITRGTLTLAGPVLGAANDHHVVTPDIGRIQRFIAGQDSFQFPIGPTATSYNPITITNLSTNAEPISFRAGVKGSISYPLPAGAAVLQRQWKLDAAIFGGVETELTFQWDENDPVIGQFNPEAGIAIGKLDGSQTGWIETAATYDPGPPHRATASFSGFGGGEFIVGNLGTTTGVAEDKVPKEFALYQNYPNPFNPSTTIRYALPKSGYVTLKIYDLLGKKVATLLSEVQVAGEHTIQWNPVSLSSGIYLYRLQAGEFVVTRKLILVQ